MAISGRPDCDGREFGTNEIKFQFWQKPINNFFSVAVSSTNFESEKFLGPHVSGIFVLTKLVRTFLRLQSLFTPRAGEKTIRLI